jgi:hypothetical protein
MLGLALLTAAGLLLGGAAWAFFRWYMPQEFPGAIMTSDRSSFRLASVPSLRRDTSYSTTAPFNEVYKWYSITFKLGPEQYGIGTCIQMARSSTALRVFNVGVGVMVCDTPYGQTVLVSRTLTLDPR